MSRDIDTRMPITEPHAGLRNRVLVCCISLALIGTASAADKTGTQATLGAPPVFNCNDNGPGSLRLSIANATSGSTVDASSLSCSTITLTTGALVVAQGDLTLLGSSEETLTIDGGGQDRVLQHVGSGTLTMLHLNIANGGYDGGSGSGVAAGGCIYSAGSLSLFDVHVSDCSVAANTSATATGGAVFTAADLTLRFSTIAHSNLSNTLGSALGGGAYVNGRLTSNYSTIAENSAVAFSPYFGGAGGIAAFGSGIVAITGSAIVNNHASHSTGGLAIICCTTAESTIVNSTVSGNRSDGVVGGLVTGGPTTLANSTVAFNFAATSQLSNGDTAAAGVVSQSYALDLQSSIISNNFAGATMLDLSVFDGASVTGADSLVMAPVAAVPVDTLVGINPQLAPLASNGGPTPSHAINASSPALDVGNNVSGLLADQRGSGFPRTLGNGTDIGAFELDADRIFADGFEPQVSLR